MKTGELVAWGLRSPLDQTGSQVAGLDQSWVHSDSNRDFLGELRGVQGRRACRGLGIRT